LANVDTNTAKIPAQGPAYMVGSMPVVIAKDQAPIPVTGTFTSSGVVGLQDTTSTQINPATDDSITYLRRMVRQIDSLAVVDTAQRQKVTVDSISAGVTLPTITTVGTVTTVSTVTGVTTVSTVTAVTTVSTVNTVTSLNQLNGVDPRYLLMDTAHNVYANVMRSNLQWT
jgi:hypothetical protein